MTRKLTVYLADLANTKFGCSPATVPLTVGFLKAYATSQLSDEVDIQLFRTFESLHKAITSKEPDIIGCAWYGWNRCLTINALTYIKSKFPKIITVVGGANAPEKAEGCLKDLKEFACLDMIISGEGEIPLVNLLKVCLQGGRESVFKTALDGVFYLSESRELVTGDSVPLAEDIDIFPSPYLAGHLDEFLADGDLMPILQTSRGCPYHCTFCVSGMSGRKKVRGFALERLKAEIDYLGAQAKNRAFRLSDDNFGLFPRDVELARYIAAKAEESGYPQAIRLYTAKNFNKYVKEIILLLKKFIPFNISFQTMTEVVLKNIKRKNINLDNICQTIEWSHQNNVNVTTELIFGLPGETYESFLKIIDNIAELRLDSTSAGPLFIYKEIELGQPESIKKYGYKIKYSIAERGYTKDGEFESIEIDRHAVQNTFYDFNEYINIRLFIELHAFFMYTGYFKEMMYMLHNRGVKITDVIMEILNRPDNYPLISEKLDRIKKCYKENLFESEEAVCEYFRSLFSDESDRKEYIGFKDPHILTLIAMGEMIHPANQEKVIDEVIKAATAIFKKCGIGDPRDFSEEMQFAKVLVQNIILPFWEIPEETVALSSPYDLLTWSNKNYHGNLSEYRLSNPVKLTFRVNMLDAYVNFVPEKAALPFYLQAEYFYRTFRSNNLRRFIVAEPS